MSLLKDYNNLSDSDDFKYTKKRTVKKRTVSYSSDTESDSSCNSSDDEKPKKKTKDDDSELSSPIKFNGKERGLMYMIKAYYKNLDDEQILKIIDIINRESHLSLRVFDHFVTKYSDDHNINYPVNGRDFFVRIKYKAQLKSFKKKYFDPFRRKNKFKFTFTVNDKERSVITTIGQLNFFRWATENKIIEFIEKNMEKISNEMNKSSCQKTTTKKKKAETKRRKKNVELIEPVSNVISFS